MGLFYKYKCKKCGKRYFELPVTCRNCGTELSIICPLSTWLINPEYKMSKHCEEIHEFSFTLWKSSKAKEFEQKITGLNILLQSKQDELEELRKKRNETVQNLMEVNHEKWILENEKRNLSMQNLRLRQQIERYERTEMFNGFYKKPSIPQGTIEAVKYAMKKAHPDNGGNTEDFMRFQKVYEELTKNGGI